MFTLPTAGGEWRGIFTLAGIQMDQRNGHGSREKFTTGKVQMELKYREYGLGAFPDEQPHFLDDMMIESKEDKEEEEYVENEEVEAEADVFAEMEMEDKVKGVKEGKRKKGMRRTRKRGM
jgi:hypothetical protein